MEVKYIFTMNQYLEGKVYKRDEVVPLCDTNKYDLAKLRGLIARKLIKRLKVEDGVAKPLTNREEGLKDIEMKEILTGKKSLSRKKLYKKK